MALPQIINCKSDKQFQRMMFPIGGDEGTE